MRGYHHPGAMFPPLPGETVKRERRRRVRVRQAGSLEQFFGSAGTILTIIQPARRTSGRIRLR